MFRSKPVPGALRSRAPGLHALSASSGRTTLLLALILLGLPLRGMATGLIHDASERQVDEEITRLLEEIVSLTEQAREAAARAAGAATIEDVKRGADQIFRLMWGMPSGRSGRLEFEDVQYHGWKERWQTDETQFDSVYAARYSGRPPEITNPRHLGIIGRGRHVRLLLEAVVEDEQRPEGQRLHAEQAIHALNNVIGWTRMESGSIKNEIQPRVDLTRLWDAPKDFWRSTADTGWAWEVYAQAINILKVRYDAAEEARRHAADLERLIRRYVEGEDADGDGRIAPTMMEGGLATAIEYWSLSVSGTQP